MCVSTANKNVKDDLSRRWFCVWAIVWNAIGLQRMCLCTYFFSVRLFNLKLRQVTELCVLVQLNCYRSSRLDDRNNARHARPTTMSNARRTIDEIWSMTCAIHLRMCLSEISKRIFCWYGILHIIKMIVKLSHKKPG